jgi:hypothetical protein
LGILIISKIEDGVYVRSKRKSWQAKGEKNKFITEWNSYHLLREQSSPIRQPEVVRVVSQWVTIPMHGSDQENGGMRVFTNIRQISPSGFRDEWGQGDQ